MPWLIPVAGLALGLLLRHWIAIALVVPVWFVGFLLVALFGGMGRGMADFWFVVAMLPVGFVFAALGVAFRRFSAL